MILNFLMLDFEFKEAPNFPKVSESLKKLEKDAFTPFFCLQPRSESSKFKAVALAQVSQSPNAQRK